MMPAPYCDYCIECDAEVEIVLAEGQVFYACKICVPEVIKEQASTENPVHSMDELTEA